jgi:alpha/beta superfamily hydrolase|tara:strand:+ start:2233 stop:2964 length:732 start_codon:yes stop_codon:yes gene_type:complete
MTSGAGRFGLPRNDENEDQTENNLEEMTLSIKSAKAKPAELEGEMDVQLDTSRGDVTLHFRPVEGAVSATVFVGGAAGGVKGPADEVYIRLSSALETEAVASIRVEYRQAGEFEECVLDTLAACSFLKGIGAEKIILVGHSFGGAVVIKAAALANTVVAVGSLSSQRFGTSEIDKLNKPLLLIHGSSDDILDKAASEDIFSRANEPKDIVIIEGAGHGLSENAEDVFVLLKTFIQKHAADGIN